MKRLVIVGAGLGADSITLQGINEIKRADVVLYDRLVNSSILSYADCELIEVGKTPYDKHCIRQSDINLLITEHLNAGKNVLRLKGGDSTVFARSIEELEAAEKAGAETLIVPGITSAATLSSKMFTTLTDRRDASGVAFITGHPKGGDIENTYNWKALAELKLTIVIYMGVRNSPVIAELLIRNGMSPNTPVNIGEKLETKDERLFNCSLNDLQKTIENNRISNPATIIIGSVSKQ